MLDATPQEAAVRAAAAASSPPPVPPPAAPTRESLAHAFMAEYHRLLADALADAGPDHGRELTHAQRRAFAWRVTAGRIPHVPAARWPGWLLGHLAAAASTPIVGAEYQRQRELLVSLLGEGRP